MTLIQSLISLKCHIVRLLVAFEAVLLRLKHKLMLVDGLVTSPHLRFLLYFQDGIRP